MPLQERLAEAMEELHESEQEMPAESLDRIVEMMEVRDVDAAPISETGSIATKTKGGNTVEPQGGGEPGG